MADAAGRLFTVIDATLHPQTRDLEVATINNHANSQQGVNPEPALTALKERYEAQPAPKANIVVGSFTPDITRQTNEAGESALGDVIAETQNGLPWEQFPL